jgi:hypothetical protein
LRLEPLEGREVPAGPVANNDMFTTVPNTPTSLPVLSNDGNPDGSGVQLLGHTAVSPAGPILAQNSDGTFTFNSPSTGTFSFDYTITDRQTELTPSNPLAGGLFGASVATDGNTLVVGAPDDANVPGSGPLAQGPGAAFVFVNSGSGWTFQQELTPGDGMSGNGSNDGFGTSVAISGDSIVVGAPLHPAGSAAEIGASYVFVRSGTTWTQQQELIPSDGANGNRFGTSVGISGNSIVVGAPLHPAGSAAEIGASYVFVRSGTTWVQQQELTASDAAAHDAFGTSVGISAGSVVVGAPNHQVGSAFDAGASYVFVQSGTTWTQQQELAPGDIAAFDSFGTSVGISGSSVIVGAPDHKVATTMGTGAAYVFVQSGTTWTQQQELTASDPDTAPTSDPDRFGTSVAISGDAAVVGDPEHGNVTGAAYVFVRSGATWTLEQEQQPTNVSPDGFGTSVAISGDSVAGGASGTPMGTLNFAGAAFVQNRTKATATVTVDVVPPATVSGSVFSDVAFNGVPQPGAPGVAGITVFADLNGNGALDPGEPSTTTDAAGNYTLTGLPPGTHSIIAVLNNPTERFTSPTRGTVTVTLGAGQTVAQNFGVQLFGGLGTVPSTSSLFASPSSDPNVSYVSALYQAILGRAAGTVMTPSGPVNEAAMWTNQIESGQLTRAQVASDIVNSVEHRTAEVNEFYEVLLHRPLNTATDPGAGGWVQQLLNGVSEAAVVQGIMSSAEFQNDFADSAAFVQELYFAVLGRSASQQEINMVVAQLNSGTSRAAIEAGVVNSPESTERQVAGFYAAFLHRSPDPGASMWVNQLLAGTSASQVEINILTEPSGQEFFKDAASGVAG